MDLNILFAPQVGQLKQCYADLGYSPQRLQEALRTAIDQEVKKTLEEVEDAKSKVDELMKRCDAYQNVLAADGVTNTASKAMQTDEARFNQGTFMSRIEAWQSELKRLERQYMSRRAHVDRLIETLDAYRGILGDFVPTIEGSTNVSHSECFNLVSPIPSLRIVEESLASCTDELHRRTEVLQEDLNGVLQLWCDLALLPNTDDHLDASILRHLGVVPRLVDVGEGCMDFCGDFDEAQAYDQEEDGILETPSRKSGSQHQLSGNPSLMKPGAILPSLDNLTNVHQRRQELDSERIRRTELLQTLYDELIPLWQRFDVADEDVDAFVQANCGCTLIVLEAYESELQQMRELKSQHMALFISKVRQDIAALWDQLMMTPEERRDSFAPFFYDLADATSSEESRGNSAGIEPSDELLALHEEKVHDLQDELATRAKPLELVRQYLRLLDEARELEESAKDTSRLTGRGAPGQKRDPGRLLREEKMRKRIKILKPKVEEDLMKTIPAWEEESGRPFVVNGARFLDTVDIQPAQNKKRPRVISNAQSSSAAAQAAAATPQQNHSVKRSHIEGSAPRSVSVNSSAIRKGSAQHGPQPTPTMANGKDTRIVTGPPSGLPTPASASQKSRIASVVSGSNAKVRSATIAGTVQSQEASRMNATTTSNSSASLASQATDATTHILKVAGTRMNSMQPPPLPTPKSQVTKIRNGSAMPAKRPSMLLGESLRYGPRPSNDFVKPTSTGAGASIKIANDSIGPNWAILDDEDEENLLML
jgi:Ase1/PRC1/MAP65 family protein